MRFSISQILAVWSLFCNYFINTEDLIKLKRSPLEIGFVSFTERPHLNKYHLPLIENKTSELLNSKNDKNMVTLPTLLSSHTHKWVPGQVRHHAYIPAHLDHLYLPSPAVVLTKTVEEVFVHPTLYENYRNHYGGFGVGVDVGGQGAGHGFHVVFNI